jgi:hypothetical protein
MDNFFIKRDWIKTSKYPSDVLPKGAIPISYSEEFDDTKSSIKGFFLNDEYHIQEITTEQFEFRPSRLNAIF